MPRDVETGFLTAGVVSDLRPVPDHIIKPEYVGKRAPEKYTGSDIFTASEVESIRAAGRIAAQAIELVGRNCQPGITTDELDRIAHDFIIANGGYPSALLYRGFPKSICTSINEVICHGIPDNTVLQDGDIVNIDITVFKDGFHGDSNQTFMVGDVRDDVRLLVERTRESLKRAYSQEMQVGMVFTIEPMLTLGTHQWDMWPDDWTVLTKDKSITAQFEHTLVVTETGADILTLP